MRYHSLGLFLMNVSEIQSVLEHANSFETPSPTHAVKSLPPSPLPCRKIICFYFLVGYFVSICQHVVPLGGGNSVIF